MCRLRFWDPLRDRVKRFHSITLVRHTGRDGERVTGGIVEEDTPTRHRYKSYTRVFTHVKCRHGRGPLCLGSGLWRGNPHGTFRTVKSSWHVPLRLSTRQRGISIYKWCSEVEERSEKRVPHPSQVCPGRLGARGGYSVVTSTVCTRRHTPTRSLFCSTTVGT